MSNDEPKAVTREELLQAVVAAADAMRASIAGLSAAGAAEFSGAGRSDVVRAALQAYDAAIDNYDHVRGEL